MNPKDYIDGVDNAAIGLNLDEVTAVMVAIDVEKNRQVAKAFEYNRNGNARELIDSAFNRALVLDSVWNRLNDLRDILK